MTLAAKSASIEPTAQTEAFERSEPIPSTTMAATASHMPDLSHRLSPILSNQPRISEMAKSLRADDETCLRMTGSIRSNVDGFVRGDSPAPKIRQIAVFASSGKDTSITVLTTFQ